MKWTIRILSSCLALCALLNIPAAEAESPRATKTGTGFVSQDVGASRALPAGVRADKVKIASGGLNLSGTIYLPKPIAGKRAPAVLLISGSDLNRKGPVPIARAPLVAFSEISAHLAGSGIVALTYDSRCAGASDCKDDSTPHDYVGDANSAYLFLSRRAEVDPAKVLVLGHDEGGAFAANVASSPPEGTQKPTAVIMIAAPGRTYGKVLREQTFHRLLQSGKSPDEIKAYLAKFDLLANDLSSSGLDLKKAGIDAQDPLFTQFFSRRSYFFHMFVNDPLQISRTIAAPVLIIQGSKDMHISVKDAQYLRESLDRQYHGNVSFELLPEMDHWMRASKAAAVFRDEESPGPLDPALLTVLNTWIAKQLK